MNTKNVVVTDIFENIPVCSLTPDSLTGTMLYPFPAIKVCPRKDLFIISKIYVNSVVFWITCSKYYVKLSDQRTFVIVPRSWHCAGKGLSRLKNDKLGKTIVRLCGICRIGLVDCVSVCTICEFLTTREYSVTRTANNGLVLVY